MRARLACLHRRLRALSSRAPFQNWPPLKPGVGRVVAIAVGATVLTAVVLVVGLLFALDSGRLDASVARFASARLKRPVAMADFKAHLLTARPEIEVQGLRVGNPTWAAGAPDLVHARRVVARFRWAALLTGRLTPSELIIEGADIALLRLARDRETWRSKGGGGDPLAKVERLQISASRFSFDDRVHAVKLAGPVSHDATRPDWPLTISAQGVINGGGVVIVATGGPLNGRPKGAVYRMKASLTDGAVRIEASGTTDKPFSFGGLDLAVKAEGPNLVVLDYLLDVGSPNSTPFRVRGRIQRRGEVTRASGLDATVGESDFKGEIVSDGTGKRRTLRIDLASDTVHIGDLASFFAARPSHAVARMTPGRSGGSGARLFSDNTLDLTRFNRMDAALKLRARRFVTGPFAPGRLVASGTLDHGVFVLAPLEIAFPTGRLTARYRLDVRRPQTGMSLDARVVATSLAALAPRIGEGLDGETRIQIHAAGAGRSLSAIAANARGDATLTLKDGELKRSSAQFLSGALVQGALSSLVAKSARTPLSCARVHLAIGGGQAVGREMVMATKAGTTAAQGGVDLRRETMNFQLYGRPSGFTLFRSRKPVTVSGPLLHPKVELAAGAPSVTPPEIKGDPTSFCQALLSR